MNPPRITYIALGSNKGNRLEMLQKAVDQVHQKIGEVARISSVFETPAWGFEGGAFLNACIGVFTRCSPEKVLQEVLAIEKNLGRERSQVKGYSDRTIDLDVLLYEEQIIQTADLQIPHPQIAVRDFVLQPLAEIGPEEFVPPGKKRVKDLLKELPENSELTRTSYHLQKPPAFTFTKYNYVAVEGNIGAGKTSFATMVSEDFNAKLILERFKDNAFLPKFYQDQQRYAFPLEMSFLADRYQQLSDDLAQYDLFKDFIISDYDVFKSLIFAKITLQEEEYALYHKLFHIMYKELVKPDLYIYLYQNTERLLENIKKRGRHYEQNIQQEYLANINKSYLSFIKSQPGLNVKILDISDLDFVQNREDYLKLLNEIS